VWQNTHPDDSAPASVSYLCLVENAGNRFVFLLLWAIGLCALVYLMLDVPAP
jgi:hypothetical protein